MGCRIAHLRFPGEGFGWLFRGFDPRMAAGGLPALPVDGSKPVNICRVLTGVRFFGAGSPSVGDPPQSRRNDLRKCQRSSADGRTTPKNRTPSNTRYCSAWTRFDGSSGNMHGKTPLGQFDALGLTGCCSRLSAWDLWACVKPGQGFRVIADHYIAGELA